MSTLLPRLAACVIAVIIASPADAAKYTFSQIDYPTRWATTNAVLPNGDVVVSLLFDADQGGFQHGQRSYVWSTSGAARPLQSMDGYNSTALAMNSAGSAVGISWLQEGKSVDQATIWRNGNAEFLPSVGDGRSRALGINDSGKVAGYADFGGSRGGAMSHAVVWDSQGAHDLGTFEGVSAKALDVNNDDQVVGYRQLANGDISGFVLTRGVAQYVGTLGGNKSWLYSINAGGWAVGESNTSGDTERRAVLWDGTRLIDLGMPNAYASVANSIRDDGTIYGFTESEDHVTTAVMWKDGRGSYLHDLVANRADMGDFIFSSIAGADAQGRIYGTMSSGDGATYESRTFVLTPVIEAQVPEPAPLLLLLAGIGLLAQRRNWAPPA